MFFAEVRPFDEIFRESQAMQEEQNSDQQGQGGETQKLAELQKQIMSATWKLQRQPPTPKYPDDAAVGIADAGDIIVDAADAGSFAALDDDALMAGGASDS